MGGTDILIAQTGEIKIDYLNLGHTGVKVSKLCLGCMNFGSRTDQAESTQIIHRALDAGFVPYYGYDGMVWVKREPHEQRWQP